jgi:hypothetical protein
MFKYGSLILQGVLCALLGAGAFVAPLDAADPVPAVYQPLYTELNGLLSNMESAVNSQWNGAKQPVSFGANLLSANTSRGPSLLNPYAMYGIMIEASRLKSLGATVVNIGVGYPTLLPRYYSDAAQAQKYIDFYKTLVAELKKIGLEVAISSGPEPNLAYYRTLSLDGYIQGRVDVLSIIANQVRPDYLVMASEPDIEASFSGHAMNDVASTVRLIEAALPAVAAARSGGVQVGAGIGTWQGNGTKFIDSICQTGIDFVDLHIFPVNRDFFTNVITYANTAKSHGKAVSISQAWLYKSGTAELGTMNFNKAAARDPFSFWAPLDSRFLEILAKTSHLIESKFTVAQWSRFFFTYLPWEQAGGLTPDQLTAASIGFATQNMLNGVWTPTAAAYKAAIR